MASLPPSSPLYVVISPTLDLNHNPTSLRDTGTNVRFQPSDYPLSPFKMKFEPPLFHPNGTPSPSDHASRLTFLLFLFWPAADHAGFDLVYPDGTVCISILHTPGDDPTMYEQASERWSPVQSVEKVLLSVISMLAGTPTSLATSIRKPWVLTHFRQNRTWRVAPTLTVASCIAITNRCANFF